MRLEHDMMVCMNQHVRQCRIHAGHTETTMAILDRQPTNSLVNDETFMLSLADAMLARHGYTVLTATSAPEVLHMFEIWPDLKIDVAVLDCRHAGNGWV